jgi:hypothetical protein
MSGDLQRLRAIVKGRSWGLRKLRRPARYRGKTIRYVFWDGLSDRWCASLAEVENLLRWSAHRVPAEVLAKERPLRRSVSLAGEEARHE